MALRLTYNTQLNTRFRIFKIYTPWEFMIGVCLSAAPVLVSALIGLQPSFWDTFVVFILYSLFIVYFKIGRAEGYLPHWISHLLTPSEMRPGLEYTPYPITGDDLDLYERTYKRTREMLFEDTRQLQQLMVENNVIPMTSYGTYLVVNPDTPEGEAAKTAALEMLRNGELLGSPVPLRPPGA